MRKTLLLAVTGLLQAAAVAATPAAAKELKSIGISLASLGNPFFMALAKGAETEAKTVNPNVKITTTGYDNDPLKQNAQIENFIAAGVDLILLNPGDPKAIEPAIRHAREAGIHVVAVDADAAGSDATVRTNNVQAGEIACRYIVDALKSKGNVIIENGPQVSSLIDRVNGCKAVFDKTQSIKVLSSDQVGDGSSDGGLRLASDLLIRFPQVNAFFCVNDQQALGSALAAKQHKRTDLIITSVDVGAGIQAELNYSAQSPIKASASQDPFFMGRKAVQIGVGLLNGQKPAQTLMLLPSGLITSNNVNQYSMVNKMPAVCSEDRCKNNCSGDCAVCCN